MEAIFANIQNALISRILGVFLSCFFAWNKDNVVVDSFLICLRQFYFLTQSYDFSKAIGQALRPFLPTFKLVSFLQYEVFFRAVFCVE